MTVKRTAVGLARFTLHRVGVFTVQTFGKTHCGTVSPLSIRYDVRITCTSDSLDSRGFLFDQVKIDQWFQAQHETGLSCEQYTLWCGRELYKLVLGENADCHISHFVLNLSPWPHAADLTFEYGE